MPLIPYSHWPAISTILTKRALTADLKMGGSWLWRTRRKTWRINNSKSEDSQDDLNTITGWMTKTSREGGRKPILKLCDDLQYLFTDYELEYYFKGASYCMLKSWILINVILEYWIYLYKQCQGITSYTKHTVSCGLDLLRTKEGNEVVGKEEGRRIKTLFIKIELS